ncbi:hypothetical protein NEMBOFW57_010666 [Staphylotrichum longicolle]|uniref:Heterokaryon incompatibility domain-containing protein n=1 Tax=Staphylotrichum longicolle TaxID=669026 RepID=A0AAD4HUG5_9PEZI|nr:hypothetical protein NEMBOFW57_010666 [Staphylotrichum longicolle]
MSSGSQNPGPCPSGIQPKAWEAWGLLNKCNLCHGCRGMLGLTPDLQRRRDEGGRFETELAELETAALDALGCPFCRAAYRAFNHFNGKMSQEVQVEFSVGYSNWRNVNVHWYVEIPPEVMADPGQWGPDGTFCITIEQAVEVCVCLGIEYLWVDALCIIQDNTADWEREAKKMATVYTMATVTIIAASSTSSYTETKAGTLNLRPRAVNRWYGVVQNFNQRNFTVATDKLPAFSGVVKKLAPEMAAGAGKRSLYIAGLWRHLMLPGEDLLWYRYAGAPAHCYQDYVAPSFSWASVGTRIVFSNVDINIGSWLSELVNADRKLAPNSDEFGKVLQAFLTLRSPLISCTIRKLPNQNPELELSPGQKLMLQSYRLDCAVSQVTLQTGKATVQRSASSGSSFSDTDAHILLLQTQESRLLNCHMLRGLLLGQLATSGEFQRLGLVRLQGSAEDVMKLKLEQQKQLVTIV